MSLLLTAAQQAALIANGHRSLANGSFDPMPIVKLFTPDAGVTWLLSEIDPNDHTRAFGLCDLGPGFPELEWVCLTELIGVRGRLRLPVEPDLHWSADKALSAYAAEARALGRIAA